MVLPSTLDSMANLIYIVLPNNISIPSRFSLKQIEASYYVMVAPNNLPVMTMKRCKFILLHFNGYYQSCLVRIERTSTFEFCRFARRFLILSLVFWVWFYCSMTYYYICLYDFLSEFYLVFTHFPGKSYFIRIWT